MMMIIWNRASSKLLFKLDWTFKDSMVEFHIHHGIKMRYQPGKLVTFQVESTCWAERHVDTTTKGRAIALRPASRLRRSSRKENNLLGRTAGSSLSTLFELTFTHTQIFGVCVCVCVWFLLFSFFLTGSATGGPEIIRPTFSSGSVRPSACLLFPSFVLDLPYSARFSSSFHFASVASDMALEPTRLLLMSVSFDFRCASRVCIRFVTKTDPVLSFCVCVCCFLNVSGGVGGGLLLLPRSASFFGY